MHYFVEEFDYSLSPPITPFKGLLLLGTRFAQASSGSMFRLGAALAAAHGAARKSHKTQHGNMVQSSSQ